MDRPIAANARSDWRFVIRAYLDAQWEDQRRRHEADFQNCEARCLREFAAENVCRDHEQMIRHRLATLEMPPPESAYEVVQEDPHRVVALVDKRPPGSIWSLVTRFTLENNAAEWKIVAVSIPCSGCSPRIFERHKGLFSPQEGLCVFCGGSGKTRALSKRWRWFFRRLVMTPAPCPPCDGKGICQRCVQSSEKGWMNSFTAEAEMQKRQPKVDP